MKTLFCDLCGNEIDEDSDNYAKIQLHGLHLWYVFENQWKEKQICEKCYKEIFNKGKNEEEK